MNGNRINRFFRLAWPAALGLLLLAGASNESKATHAAGSDLTYQCLGGLQYRVQVAFYRDCAGVDEPNNISLSYSSASCGYNLSATATKVAGTGLEITVPCGTSSTACNGGSTTGIRKWVYQATITLPAACSDWVFSYQVCCRNCAITTVQNPCANSSNLYVESTLNNLTAPCNSSPTFSNIPIAFACLGQGFNFNQGMMDADGDSLAYELAVPKINASGTVSYVAPHSVTQPILSSTPFTLNPITGQISFTPSAVEIGILAVKVKEYRNGVQIGSVIRDMQIYVSVCPNNLPTASGVNNTTNYSAYGCPGQSICFTVHTADADAAQNVSIVHNNGIPGATYTISGGSRPVLTFCWTPTEAQVSATPYVFTVTVQDNACPTNGIQIYSYDILVFGPAFTLTSSNPVCNGAATGSLAAAPSSLGAHNYSWSTGATTASLSGMAAGTYTVTVTHATSGCNLTKSATLTQPPAITGTATAATQVSCFGGGNGSVTLASGGGTPPLSYNWSNGATTQNLNGLTAGTYTVTITDANGCTASRSATVTQPAAALAGAAALSQPVSCFGGSDGSVSLNPSGGMAPYAYQWSHGATTQNPTGLSAGP
jgi:hypothetical protein